MKIKVCGMKYPENITAVASLAPDYMGFIFWKGSARYFDGVLPEIPSAIKKVGVFVDASKAVILKHVSQHKLDLVQLHGNESAAFCKDIKDSGIQVIKAFAVAPDFDFAQLTAYEHSCDFFLFDTKGKSPGGNGITFDWNLLGNYHLAKPIFLSGGIGPDSSAAIKNLDYRVHAIDINSRFELKPGLKNSEAIHNFKNEMT